MKQYIEIGEIVTTHGIGGEVKLYPWCDGPQFVTGFKRVYFSANGGTAVGVSARVQKNMALLKLEGVDTVEAAHALIGKIVYISRADAKLPKGRYFVQDLMGLTVKDAQTGKVYGTISNVSHPGSSDIYEIKAEDGETYLFPAVEEFLGGIDFETGEVLVKPIEGMFTDAD